MADIVLSPNLKKFKSSKLVGDAKEMIEEGENVVLSRKDEIIKLLNQKPRKNKIKWIQKDVEHI